MNIMIKTLGAPGKIYTRHGSFIKNPDQFDTHYFNISPREAKLMDPQSPLTMLET